MSVSVKPGLERELSYILTEYATVEGNAEVRGTAINVSVDED